MRTFLGNHKQAVATLPLILFNMLYGAWHMTGISSLLLVISLVLFVSVPMQHACLINHLKPVNYTLVGLNICLIMSWLTWDTMDSLEFIPVVLGIFGLCVLAAILLVRSERDLRHIGPRGAIK